MDQKKTGSFLKVLRNEKGLTQEQLAEKLGVSGRTVSRWENGNNMPDLSILVELSDFYEVDIREIIDGERKSENMNEELKDTMEKVAEYVEADKERKAKKLNRHLLAGIGCIVLVLLNQQFCIFSYVFQENAAEFVSGFLCGLGLVFEFIGLYNNNHEVSLKQRKMALLKKGKNNGNQIP